jgi:hypothetical protein
MNPDFTVTNGKVYEAYIKPCTPGAWEYQYRIADYQNNTRLVITEDGDDEDTEPDIIQEMHYSPYGRPLNGNWNNSDRHDYQYKYNDKEVTEDYGLNHSNYGARWQDLDLIDFTTIDRFSDQYPWQSPYVHGARNPIKFIDVNGDSIRISDGNGGFHYYVPGEEYDGENNEFLSKVTSQLNRINQSKAGASVLKTLNESTNKFDLLNEKPNNSEAGAQFKPNQNGGGDLLVASIDDITHEIYHGYQNEFAPINNNSTSIEIGAYLFENIVSIELGGGISSGSQSNFAGDIYERSYNNLLFDGYSDHDYINANITFKAGSRQNSSGIYNKIKVDFKIRPYPLIRKFLQSK